MLFPTCKLLEKTFADSKEVNNKSSMKFQRNRLTDNLLITENFFSNFKQILYNIKQEYKRMQKRRHLETSFQQTDPCCASNAQPHAFLLSGPASPGTPSGTSSPLKKEQPLFTLRQVGMICERLLKEREEKVREEYEEILNTKLAEQYDAFVKFTHDQIMRRYGEQPASWKC
ncbi:AKIRIN2 [Cervus elaphus hippelaphus]|uniref:Akirin-2 n=1 Tax=Cervus elaphus hippelaphus TaxID=46360 RepID=A0A212C5U9_CEREH|nr:AKIRIN2 [Cervus elaphus hippelaphus]